MSSAGTPAERLRGNAVGLTTMLVLGVGLLALFLGVPNFWLIFALGFAVVVPIVAMLYGEENEQEAQQSYRNRDREESRVGRDQRTHGSETDDGPLETLRRRYARGELTDAQFERKLEALLETETLEDAEDRRQEHEFVREHES
jgi:uncharacterized membrane protein